MANDNKFAHMAQRVHEELAKTYRPHPAESQQEEVRGRHAHAVRWGGALVHGLRNGGLSNILLDTLVKAGVTPALDEDRRRWLIDGLEVALNEIPTNVLDCPCQQIPVSDPDEDDEEEDEDWDDDEEWDEDDEDWD